MLNKSITHFVVDCLNEIRNYVWKIITKNASDYLLPVCQMISKVDPNTSESYDSKSDRNN